MPDLFSSPIANNTIAKPVPFGVKPYQEPVGAYKPPMMPDGTPVPQMPPQGPQMRPQQSQNPNTWNSYRDLYAGLQQGLSSGQTPSYPMLDGYGATQAGYLPDWAIHRGQMQQQGAPTTNAPTSGNAPRNGGGLGFGGGFSGDGGDDNECVLADSYLSNGMRAAQLPVGALYDCHHPVEGFHKSTLEAKGDLVSRSCVLLTTDGGAKLACSKTTPFNFVGVTSDLEEGGYALAPDMQGHDVYVLRDGKQSVERVVSVEDLGERLVVPLSFGGRSFPAGVNADALIYSHNIRKAVSGASQIANMEAMRSRFGGGRESNFMESGAGVLGPQTNPNGNFSAGQSWAGGGGTVLDPWGGDGSGFDHTMPTVGTIPAQGTATSPPVFGQPSAGFHPLQATRTWAAQHPGITRASLGLLSLFTGQPWIAPVGSAILKNPEKKP